MPLRYQWMPRNLLKNRHQNLEKLSEEASEYRDGVREGIVIKTYEGDFLKESFKVVNKHFKLRDDFNTAEAIRNKVI